MTSSSITTVAGPGPARGVADFYRRLWRYPRDRIPCRAMDAELWFTRDAAGQRSAAAWCVTCPVRVECRRMGRLLQATHGVWGGESPRERRRAGCIPRK